MCKTVLTNKNHLGSLKPCENSFDFIRFHIIFVKSWSNIETPIKVCLDSIASRTIQNLFSLQESENENLHSFLQAYSRENILFQTR